ncbi:MAG: serine/threonine protein kinase [Gemmatimonadetes bacterium]|nr:serine/threonine protein kinase [Gemmatimonadota bacterium]
MSLSADRWRIVKAAFAELAELPADLRAIRLAEMTFNDPELRAEVESLLAAADEVGERFERPPVAMLDGALEPVVGERIGPYLVVRELGRGGMGTVYEAHRADDAFQKRVALKMVARGRDTDAILRRFRYERQILARLEHRNIAALLDGGVTASGQPYFVMEYVEGQRIDHYCAERQLPVAERLKLFRQVCAAVHYAHQNLVVHRDLKPSNILVGTDGTVKLLDFGIAKLLDPDAAPDEPLTVTGVAPMTTAYASPEQLQGFPVTTASDVYSLGVILYQLLTGRLPFDGGDLPLLEARRRMLESVPVPPSRAVTTTAAGATDPSTRRLQRALAGELDNIVMMALRKEPDRRYTSVESLGEDVLRFAAGLPIRATPDSLGYRLGKLVRRNRVAVVATGVALAAVVGGAGVSVWQARTARLERDRAERERAKAEQVTEFFRNVILTASPTRLGPRVTVLEAIDAAIPRIDSAFAADLWMRTALRSTIGTTFYEIGLPDRAGPMLREALAMQETLDSGRVTWAGATAIYNVAGVELQLGRLATAESLFRRSMALYESLPDQDPAEIAKGWGQVALVVGNQGRTAEAIDLSKKVVDLLRSRAGPRDRGLPVAIANYASLLTEAGRFAEAEPLYREAVTLMEASNPRDPAVGAFLQPLAINLLYAGRVAAAESAGRRSLEITEAALGPDNPTTLTALRGLLNVLVDAGKCPEAIERARGVIARRGTVIPDSDLTLGSAYLQLGECLVASGDPRGGLAALREGVRLREATLPDDHWALAYGRSLLGMALVRNGLPVDGERLLRAGHERLVAALGADHYRTRQAAARLAETGR